jgi:hypothetical protein
MARSKRWLGDISEKESALSGESRVEYYRCGNNAYSDRDVSLCPLGRGRRDFSRQILEKPLDDVKGFRPEPHATRRGAIPFERTRKNGLSTG